MMCLCIQLSQVVENKSKGGLMSVKEGRYWTQKRKDKPQKKGFPISASITSETAQLLLLRIYHKRTGKLQETVSLNEYHK